MKHAGYVGIPVLGTSELQYVLYWLILQLLQEPDAFDANNDDDDKRATLLIMNFSVDEVDSALDKLGMQIVYEVSII